MGDVPQALRTVLEEALCEVPSQENLDKYLPNIREIIVGLLQSLKKKQTGVRRFRETHSSTPIPQAHQISNPIPQERVMSAELPSTVSRPRGPRISPPIVNVVPQHSPPPNSLPHSRPPVPNKATPIEPFRSSKIVNPDKNNLLSVSKLKDPLKELQNGDSLKRRASRRFSAYQYARLTSNDRVVPIARSDSRLQQPDQDTPPREKLKQITETNGTIAPVKAQQTPPDKPPIDKPDDGSRSIFLKIGERVKKVDVQLSDITLASLRLLFVNKFTYSPADQDFPDIYIMDSQSGVQYELEENELRELSDKTLLVLHEEDSGSKQMRNLESKLSLFSTKISEMESNIMSKIGTLEEELPSKLNETVTQLEPKLRPPTVSVPTIDVNNANENSKEIIDTKENPEINGSDEKPHTSDSSLATDDVKKLEEELLNCKRELAIMRQINNDNSNFTKTAISEIVAKFKELKTLDNMPLGKFSDRAHMDSSHVKLSKDSDILLSTVDDIQDIVESLRKDVAQRGVRPAEKQMSKVAKNIHYAQSELAEMSSYIEREKPSWKKIWEKELDTVCEEQQFFNLQEDLVQDLQDDLEKALETFALVEQCCEQFNASAPKQPVILPLLEPGHDASDVKNALLIEVSSLRPNHQSRVEAIERAEKLRKKELDNRIDEFEEELTEFVGGGKLKKSGGFEEVERQRKLKDAENLKLSLKAMSQARG